MKVFHDYDNVCGSFHKIDVIEVWYRHFDRRGNMAIELCFALVGSDLYSRSSTLRIKCSELNDYGARSSIVVPIQVDSIVRSDLSCADGFELAISELNLSPEDGAHPRDRYGIWVKHWRELRLHSVMLPWYLAIRTPLTISADPHKQHESASHGARIRNLQAMPRFHILIAAFVSLLFWGCSSSDKSAIEEQSDSTVAESDASSNTSTSLSSTEPWVEVSSNNGRPVISVLPRNETPTELVVRDILVGTGVQAEIGDVLEVNYAGVLLSDGTEFDASWNR